MKKMLSSRFLIVAAAGLMMTSLLSAQSDKSKRPSPPATATGKIGGATVTIDYSSPSVKGRKIFGGLEPYGKVWRAGANEATVFQTDKEIKVEGKTLAAGKYSLFATPGETDWTIIFNSVIPPWGVNNNGDANLDPAKNALTVTVKSKKAAKLIEKLAYEVNSKGFVLSWENVEVPVAIK